MASLCIDFSYDDNVISSIKSAKGKISSRISDYDGIVKNLNNISGSGNITTANSYLKKKISSLQGKYDRLDALQGRISTFNSNAESAEKRVADRINTETNEFYKRENIPHGVWYTICSAVGSGVEWLKGKVASFIGWVGEGLASVWKTIKDFYENNKYWIDLIVDAVLVVAAVAGCLASGGALAFAFAAWGLAKATTDLVYDIGAFAAYKDGNMELYEELSEKGLKDLMQENMGDTGEFLYYGLEIASSIYSVYKLGKAGVKAIKSYKTFKDSYGKVLTPETFKGCKADYIKSNIWKNIVGTGVHGDNSALQSGFFHNGKLIFKIPLQKINTAKFVTSTFKTWFSDDSAGVKALKTFKITKTLYDVPKNILNYPGKTMFPGASPVSQSLVLI